MERTEKRRSRRKRWLGVVAAAAVVMAVIVSIAFWPRPKEPEYQGKKLSEWLDVCRYDRLPKYGNPGVPEEQLRDAVRAIRQIGTNGFPLLVRWLDLERATSGQAYRIAEKLPAGLRQLKVISSYLARPYQRLDAARIGFEILGSQAFEAIPDLARLLERPAGQTTKMAASLLYHLGEPMQPAGHTVLRAALGNPKADRISIVRAVGDGPNFGSETGLWVSALERCMSDGDNTLANEAVKALGSMGKSGAYYINEWHGRDHFYGWGSPNKAAVLPALKRALENRDPSIRAVATNAILEFAPEVLLSEWELREREARGETPTRIILKQD